MTQPLTSAVQGVAGQPSSVRIGRLQSISPVQVDLQGVTVTNVGVAGGVPFVGGPVALLGQSSNAGSDPTSWLMLGGVSTSLPGVLDGAITGTGTFVTGVSAETTITQLDLSASLQTGGIYLAEVQALITVTVTTDDFTLRVRRDTALTGTEVGLANFSGYDLVNTPYFAFPFEASATQTTSLFFSIQRSAGAGTFSVNGAPGAGITRTWSAVSHVGWTTAAGGTWRTNVT